MIIVMYGTQTTGLSKVLIGYLLLSSMVFTWFFVQRPYLNWDMIGYVAAARSYEIRDARILQQDVYDNLKRSVPEEAYLELTSGHAREIRATDPQSLQQHLPFYRIRPVYVWLILAFWRLGVNPFFASYFISVICAVCAIWLLSFLLPGKPSWLYLLAIPLIALSTGFPELAKNSTPDALSALAIILCYWLLFRRHKLILVVLPACVLIRTELLLLAACFYVYLLVIKAVNRNQLIASALVSIGLYLGVNYSAGNYGWSTVFDYTFYNRSTHPADFTHTVTLASYLGMLKPGILSLLNQPLFTTYLVMTGLGLTTLLKYRNQAKDCQTTLHTDLLFTLLSSLIYVALHFLFFPVSWVRFYSAQFALAMSLVVYLSLHCHYLEPARKHLTTEKNILFQ